MSFALLLLSPFPLWLAALGSKRCADLSQVGGKFSEVIQHAGNQLLLCLIF